MSSAQATPAPASSGWLYGPAVDVLLGYGLAYVLSIPLLLWIGAVSNSSTWPFALAALFALLTSTPHYGATLLRVYQHRTDRRRYAFFAIWATALLLLLLVAGVKSILIGSVLLTLYGTWSPWHFAGQNYGLGLMSLRRRGVEIRPGVKRTFYASFVLSTVLAFLAIHGEGASAVYAIGSSTEVDSYTILRLGIPHAVVLAAAPITLALYLAAVVGAFVGLRRAGATFHDLGPTALITFTQALWFTVPALSHATGSYAVDSLPFAAVWISTAHAVQYLWVTSYYVKREKNSTRMISFLAKATLAGVAIVSVPGLLLAPGLLGDVHWFGGLAVLIFSVVNLHHFVLDGAIWKLRDGRVARLLLRSGESGGEEIGPPSTAAALVRPLLWVVGVASLAVTCLMTWELEVGRPGGTRDAERADLAARRLAWIRRENPSVWANAAQLHVSAGNVDRAIDFYRRALALDARWQYQNNLADLLANHRSADPSSAYEAVRLSEAAADAVGRSNAAVLETLASAYFSARRLGDARATAQRALAIARSEGDAALAAAIAERLATYEAMRPAPPQSFLPGK